LLASFLWFSNGDSIKGANNLAFTYLHPDIILKLDDYGEKESMKKALDKKTALLPRPLVL
jgi:hypothetical protein